MNYSQAITALIALVAVVVGPLVMLKIADRQIRAQVLSANRQKWIDDLRCDLAEIIALFLGLMTSKLGSADWAACAQRALEIESRIRLRMNPGEDEHQKLITVVEEA